MERKTLPIVFLLEMKNALRRNLVIFSEKESLVIFSESDQIVLRVSYVAFSARASFVAFSENDEKSLALMGMHKIERITI